MKKKDKLNWTFEGEKFTVGESLASEPEDNIHKHDWGVVVFHEGRLYLTAHEKVFGDRVQIFDFFNNKAKSFWINPSKVFRVLKISQ